MPFGNVFLSNANKIANSYLDSIGKGDVSKWHLKTICHLVYKKLPSLEVERFWEYIRHQRKS